MSGFIGADPEQLDALARAFADASRVLETARLAVSRMVHTVPWRGEHADRFREDWDRKYSRVLSDATGRLTSEAAALRFEAQQQVDASTAGTGAGGGRAQGAPPVPSPGQDGGLVHALKGLFDTLGGVGEVAGVVVGAVWSSLIPAAVSDIARYVSAGGKGLSLRLVSELEDLTAKDASEADRALAALAKAGGADSVLARLPAVAKVLDEAGTGLSVLGGVATFIDDLQHGKNVLQAGADGVTAGGVPIAVSQAGALPGLMKIPEAWVLTNGVQYIINNIGSHDVATGWSEFLNHPGDAFRITGDKILSGDVGAGVLNAVSGGLVPNDPNQIRADLHYAIAPQPPADFNSVERIAANASLQYHKSGWDAAPVIGLAFQDSSSDAQRALYQGVLSNDMINLVQHHDYQGINQLVNWIKQQPFGNDDVVKPYEAISWSLWHDPGANTSSTTAAQNFVFQALGRDGTSRVVQGTVNP